MIKLTRVDDRLVHGQVAFTWTPALGIDCLLVANDKVAKDDFQKMTLGLGKPSGVKLLIKSISDAISFLMDSKNGAQKILLLIDSVKDALAVSDAVPEIQSVNFGGIRGKTGSRAISKSISVTEEDILMIRELLAKGLELEVRQVPTDRKQMVENLI
jgi:mannose/fructose/N-acetylgalactosamine-specific phosphotransferase system component IIB